MLIVNYAPPGKGKTTDAWAAAGGRGIIAGSKADVRPIQTVYGVDVDKIKRKVKNVDTLEELLDFAETISYERPFIVDDFSRMAKNTRMQLEAEYALVDKDGTQKGLDRNMWTVLRSIFVDVVDHLRYRSGLVVVAARLTPFQAAQGGKQPKPKIEEGPDTGWNKLMDELCYEAEIVQRFEVGEERWNGRALCDPLEFPLHKDRLTIAGVDRPANTRALLRSAGVEVPAWPQKWIDEATLAISEEILGGETQRKVSKAWRTRLKGKPSGLAYLAIRDGIHLAEVLGQDDLLSTL